MLRRWESSLDGAGLHEEQVQRVKRALEPCLGSLVELVASRLEDGRSDGTGASSGEEIRVLEPCAFDEGLRGLSVFRRMVAETVCCDGVSLTPAEIRSLIAATEDCATPLVFHLHDCDLQHRAGMRDRFVAILGHELRNPLNAITLSATSLLRRPLPAGEETYVRHIVDGARRMAQMIGDLLEVASCTLQAEDVALASENGSLAQICREAVDEMRITHPSKVITLGAAADGRGNWDRHRLLRALQNLLANAVAYGKPDAPVGVRVLEEAHQARISVHSEGTPIDEATQRTLFEPFARGPGSAGLPGLGLGLFIARAIARAHGGDVTLESSAAHGTTFFVHLPLPSTVPKPRALVVDDERALGIAMKRRLDAMGFETLLSDSGEHAWDRIRRGHRFALVVSDIRMPGMDGPTFLEAARCLWPEIATKAVFVSGSAPFDAEPMSGVLCFGKPVTSEFYEHVRRVLEASR
ncbi:MAG TPA: hybrid sensor histidine kinase/response regulator [Polyangiaceae bacterium]